MQTTTATTILPLAQLAAKILMENLVKDFITPFNYVSAPHTQAFIKNKLKSAVNKDIVSLVKKAVPSRALYVFIPPYAFISLVLAGFAAKNVKKQNIYLIVTYGNTIQKEFKKMKLVQENGGVMYHHTFQVLVILLSLVTNAPLQVHLIKNTKNNFFYVFYFFINYITIHYNT